MGQGSIKFKETYLENCRDSFLLNISLKLDSIPSNDLPTSILKLRDEWKNQVEMMPPGCVEIDLDQLIENKMDALRIARILENIAHELKNEHMEFSSKESIRISEFIIETID